MPILQYRCAFCNKTFEELVKNHADEVLCPECKRPAERVWCGTVYSATGKPQKRCSGRCEGCSGCK